MRDLSVLCFPGKESTLFVVLFVNRYEYEYEYDNEDFQKCISTIEGCVKEKLSLIPHTKLLIIDASSTMMKKEEIAPETLQVYLRRQNVLGTFLEHLNKRYKSLDLIAVMMELKRTVQLTPDNHLYSSDDADSDDGNWQFPRKERGSVEIHENMSCLPRLQKMEQMFEKSDL